MSDSQAAKDEWPSAEEKAKNIAQAKALRVQAEKGGLRFSAYLPPGLAGWLLGLIEKGTFHDPSEAVFVILGEHQDLVAMLSAVLRSDRAVQMSIAIVRTFVRMRELMAANKDIAARVEKLERGHDRTASVIEVLVEDIDRLAREVKGMKALSPATKRRIGFIIDDE